MRSVKNETAHSSRTLEPLEAVIMKMRIYILPMLLLSFLPACPDIDNNIGTVDSGSREESGIGDAAGGALGEADAATTPPANQLPRVGDPCNVGVDYLRVQSVYTDRASECASGICLKPFVSSELEDPDTGPFCTAECQSDDDCSGGRIRDLANPSDRTCITGYVCAVEFVVGPLCCKRLCVCKDFAGDSVTKNPVTCPGSCYSGS
jgi:hypothetical protein